MTIAEGADQSYDELLEQARTLYPGMRIGRPGRSRGYFPMIGALRALRARYDVDHRGRTSTSGRGPRSWSATTRTCWIRSSS